MRQSYAEFRDGWKVVLAGAIGAGTGVTGMLTYSRGILLNPLSDAFGWNRTEASAAASFLGIGTMIAAPFIGYLADKIGVRRIGLVSIGVLTLATLAMTQLSGNIEVFCFALVMLAIAGSGTTPLVWTRGVASWFERKRGLALAITTTGTGFAGMLTPPFLGALIKHYDWRAGYVGMAIITAATLIPVSLLFYENHGQNPRSTVRPTLTHSGIGLATAIRSVRFWQLGLGFLLIASVVSSLTVHLVALLTDAGIARDAAIYVASLLGVAVIGGRVLPGYLVDRVHPPYVAGVVLALPIIGCALLTGTGLPFATIVFATLCIGLAAGAEIDLLPFLIARYYGLKSYGKIYGTQFVMLYLGSALGPIITGRLYDLYGGYKVPLEVDIPVLAIGVLAIVTLGKPPAFDQSESDIAEPPLVEAAPLNAQ